MTLERDICKTCGNPSWLCHTANNTVAFEVRSGWCYGKAELEDYEDDASAPKLESGEYRFAVAVGLKDADGKYEALPSRTEALREMATVTRKED